MQNDEAAHCRANKYRATHDLIDVICDEFEFEWQSGNRPDLRSYLNRCEREHQRQLFQELLLVQLELRRQEQEEPIWEEYYALFPEFVEQIETVRFREPPTSHANAHDKLECPRRVAHFELMRKIGSGVTGDVWKARDQKLQREVAIKVPKNQNLSYQELTRFLREGRAAAQLHHSGIVPVFEVGRDQSIVYIASAYVDGIDLSTWIASRSPTLAQAAEICRQIATALQHAHEQGVIHRDLKPANILMDSAEQPHITDFGLARWSRDEEAITLDGQLLGTPAYMAPEQAQGHAAKVDHRADVFSLGVIFFEMLTGWRPYIGDQAATIHQILNADPPQPRLLNPTIPRDLETICLKALAKDPQRRYASANAMEEDLLRYQRGEPILARRAGVLEKSWRAIRGRPAKIAAVILGIVAMAATGAAYHTARKNHDLLGLRMIALSTEPSGARVAFVPLSKIDGEPSGTDVIKPSTRSPLRQELKPGDYLVIAALDDGRFHEVYRHVPGNASEGRGVYRHNSWRMTPDGSVELPLIRIPSNDVLEGMARFSASIAPGLQAPNAPMDFYMDTTEFTVNDYIRVMDGFLPQDKRWQNVQGDCAVTVSYDEALLLAEKVGKRLPSDKEFDIAMQFRTPASGYSPSSTIAGRVGAPDGDRTQTTPPVLGLCSNVAEWTTSMGARHLDQLGDGELANKIKSTPEFPGLATFSDYRIARGGNRNVIKGMLVNPVADRDPNVRTSISRHAVMPGLGFRCVRNAIPRFLNGD